MKNIIYILIVTLLLTACKSDEPEKPAMMLSEDKMVNILYDLTMLQSIKTFQPSMLNNNDITTSNYIYKKYNIDSITFADNHTYYASQLDVYERIHKKVSERIKKLREPYEEESKQKADSIRRVKLNNLKIDSVRAQSAQNTGS